MTPEAPIPIPGTAPWLDTWRTLFAERTGRPLAQAATVSPDGSPEARTVVLRGLSADGCPYFTMDLRSDKSRAIRSGSDVELCIWWPDPGIQIRLRGPGTPIAEAPGAWSSVREELWEAHRETERRGFAGPPPGTPIEDAPPEVQIPDRPHPNFGLTIVTPMRFDRLALGNPHVRWVFAWTAGSGWQGGRVAP